MTPLAALQLVQKYLANTYPHQRTSAQAHQLAHSPDLSFPALCEYKFELAGTGMVYPGGTKWTTIEDKAMT